MCAGIYVYTSMLPDSLDLDKWINEPPEEDDIKGDDINFFFGPSSVSSKYEDTTAVRI